MLQYLNTNQDGYIRLFSNNIEKLEIGNIIKIQTFNNVENYKIIDIQIISRQDIMRLRPYNKETLILVKHYPFNYIKNAPMRWVLFFQKLHTTQFYK